jgi:hypothetical protein
LLNKENITILHCVFVVTCIYQIVKIQSPIVVNRNKNILLSHRNKMYESLRNLVNCTVSCVSSLMY